MQTQKNKIDFSGQNIYVGFDVHLKDWKVTIMTEELVHKTFSQDPRPEALYGYLNMFVLWLNNNTYKKSRIKIKSSFLINCTRFGNRQK